jgi:hypothetical protein
MYLPNWKIVPSPAISNEKLFICPKYYIAQTDSLLATQLSSTNSTQLTLSDRSGFNGKFAVNVAKPSNSIAYDNELLFKIMFKYIKFMLLRIMDDWIDW